VVRGGGWNINADNARASRRNRNNPDNRSAQSGFVVFPTHRRVMARKVVAATRRLDGRYAAWQRGELSFAEFDASVQGWINHVRYADSWVLRTHVLSPFVF
jgi:hypothetical protein